MNCGFCYQTATALLIAVIFSDINIPIGAMYNLDILIIWKYTYSCPFGFCALINN